MQQQSRPRGRPRKYTEENTLAPARPPGRPRKSTEENALTGPAPARPGGRAPTCGDDTILLAGPEVQSRSRGRPRKTPRALSQDETSELQRGKRRKTSTAITGEVIQTSLEENDMAALEKTRKDLVDARVQFEDERWLQKLRDSDLRAWCKPVTRDLQLDTIQSFYQAMHDTTTLEIHSCVVCGLQKAAKDLQEYIWEDFLSLYVQVEHLLYPSEQDHFQCRQCFPRSNAGIC
jgi:AT hook motif